MKVILAEKPSVARDIAAVVGANVKKEGYFEGNGYQVTYAFGHLVVMAEPEEMNSAWGKPWSLSQLPMIPETWKYRVADKAGTQFKVIKQLFLASQTDSIVCATDAGREGEHIFRLIYMLSGCKKQVERLWISSLTPDAIKEGLARLKPSKDFDNLADAASARAHADWIVGLNFTRAYTCINRQLCTIGRVQTPTLALICERQIQINNFKSNQFFEILASFEPGFVARYIKPISTQSAQAEAPASASDPAPAVAGEPAGDPPDLSAAGAECKQDEKDPAKSLTRLETKAEAQAIIDAIKSHKFGTLESVLTTERRTKAPALYDLLTLQKEANKRFGYTAQETLNIAQSLYEEYKLISYPRTESRHISTDMVEELPRILSNVLRASTTSQKARDLFAAENIVPGKITTSLLRPKLSKSYVDDNKLTDHHAIIPTYNQPPQSLPEKQLNIYKLVALRFMAIFLPAEVKDETTAIIVIAEHRFRARGVVIKETGWTALEASSDTAAVRSKDKNGDGKDDKEGKETKGKTKPKSADRKDAEEAQQLPPLTKGQQVAKIKEELKEGKTSAPKPYDDSGLLSAMKNAGQDLDDEDLASYMKRSGLGTPATRAAIIERLLQTGYVERQKKAILPTAKGMALIDQVYGSLKDVALTASWEQKLADMQDGKLELKSFESEIDKFVRGILPELGKSGPLNSYASALPPGSSAKQAKQADLKPDSVPGGISVCPQCKEGIVRLSPKGASCNRWREGCKFSIWGEVYGKKLSESQIKELAQKGKTKLIKGFKKKSGEGTYNAKLVLNEEFKVRLELEESAPLGPCPQCKEGLVRSTPNGAGCSRWREGCKFMIWTEQFGKKLSEAEIKELFENRRTGLIKGFKKKSGEGTYDARLVLNDEFKVRLDFTSAELTEALSLSAT